MRMHTSSCIHMREQPEVDLAGALLTRRLQRERQHSPEDQRVDGRAYHPGRQPLPDSTSLRIHDLPVSRGCINGGTSSLTPHTM
jgi:hypothetical protein